MTTAFLLPNRHHGHSGEKSGVEEEKGSLFFVSPNEPDNMRTYVLADARPCCQ